MTTRQQLRRQVTAARSALRELLAAMEDGRTTDMLRSATEARRNCEVLVATCRRVDRAATRRVEAILRAVRP